jgi:hypothetical protein
MKINVVIIFLWFFYLCRDVLVMTNYGEEGRFDLRLNFKGDCLDYLVLKCCFAIYAINRQLLHKRVGPL